MLKHVKHQNLRLTELPDHSSPNHAMFQIFQRPEWDEALALVPFLQGEWSWKKAGEGTETAARMLETETGFVA